MTTQNLRATLVAAAVPLIVASAMAQASEWVSIGPSKDRQSEGFVDISSIKIVGPIRRVWLKFVDVPHTTKGNGADREKWLGQVLVHYAFNCDDETAKLDAQTIYFDDGTSTTAPSYSLLPSWDPVVPDTGKRIAMEYVCAWKPK
jgi:hypothetical protein